MRQVSGQDGWVRVKRLAACGSTSQDSRGCRHAVLTIEERERGIEGAKSGEGVGLGIGDSKDKGGRCYTGRRLAQVRPNRA